MEITKLAFTKNIEAHMKILVILTLLLASTGIVSAYAALNQTSPPEEPLNVSPTDLDVNSNITILPSPTSLPTLQLTDLDPSMALFSAGITWAANNGSRALYVNWYDTFCAHNVSDPTWGPWWREGQLSEIKNVTVNLLEQLGFNVTCTGEVPENLEGYDLVIFESWFAVEPKHSQLVKDYLANGGNVAVIGGAPCYFATYCRDMWPYVTGGTNLTGLSDWFGSSQFANSGGSANLVVDKPFGINLENGTTVYHIDAYGCYALADLNSDATVIARWADGLVYAFTYEYGQGRVFYQAEMNW